MGLDDVETGRNAALAHRQRAGASRVSLAVGERVRQGERRVDMARQHQVDPRLPARDPGADLLAVLQVDDPGDTPVVVAEWMVLVLP